MFTSHRELWSGRKDRRKSHLNAQEDSNNNAHWTSFSREKSSGTNSLSISSTSGTPRTRCILYECRGP